MSAPRRRLSQHERRAELLAAALRLTERRPASAVTVDEVAAEAGTSRALVYRYFESWQDLYVAAVQDAASTLLERLRLAVVGRDPRTDLERGLAAYLAFAEQERVGVAALLRGAPVGIGSHETLVAETIDGVREAVVGLVLSGLALEDDPPPGVRPVVRGWIGFVEFALLDWLDCPGLSRERLVATLQAALLAPLETLADDARVAAALDRLAR